MPPIGSRYLEDEEMPFLEREIAEKSDAYLNTFTNQRHECTARLSDFVISDMFLIDQFTFDPDTMDYFDQHNELEK